MRSRDPDDPASSTRANLGVGDMATSLTPKCEGRERVTGLGQGTAFLPVPEERRVSPRQARGMFVGMP